MRSYNATPMSSPKVRRAEGLRFQRARLTAFTVMWSCEGGRPRTAAADSPAPAVGLVGLGRRPVPVADAKAAQRVSAVRMQGSAVGDCAPLTAQFHDAMLATIVGRSTGEYVHSPFFSEQLQAFQVWLETANDHKRVRRCQVAWPNRWIRVLTMTQRFACAVVPLGAAAGAAADCAASPAEPVAPPARAAAAGPVPGPGAVGGQPGPVRRHLPLRAQALAVGGHGAAGGARARLVQDHGRRPVRAAAGHGVRVVPRRSPRDPPASDRHCRPIVHAGRARRT